MLDISKHKVNLNCPKCSRTITVSIKQITDGARVKCTICGQEIQLTNSNSSENKKVVKDINKSFNDFEKALKKLGK